MRRGRGEGREGIPTAQQLPPMDDGAYCSLSSYQADLLQVGV